MRTALPLSALPTGPTLLIQGPPGFGKTHLGVSLGVAVVQRGFSVFFCRLEELLASLRRDAELPPAQLRRRKYLTSPCW